jgi:hypothetical protein
LHELFASARKLRDQSTPIISAAVVATALRRKIRKWSFLEIDNLRYSPEVKLRPDGRGSDGFYSDEGRNQG